MLHYKYLLVCIWSILLMSSCSINHIADFNGNQPELLEEKKDVRITTGINLNFTNKPIGGELNVSYAVSSRWFVTSGVKTGGFIFPTGYGYGSDFRSFTAGGGYYTLTQKGNNHQVTLRYVRGDEKQYEVDGTNYYWRHWHKAHLYNGFDFSYSAAFVNASSKLGYSFRFNYLTTLQSQHIPRLGVYFNYTHNTHRRFLLAFTAGFLTELNNDFLSTNYILFRPTITYCFNATRKKKSH